MKVFINNAINNGILNYLNSIENKEVDKTHIFEFFVVKILINIYGEINIINPYKLGKEDSFKKNLILFGLKESDMEMFIKYMDNYDKWLNSPYLVPKTKIPTQIESIIINMILMKSNFRPITDKEITSYNDFFDPGEGDIKKIRNLIVEDPTIIPSIWRRKRSQLVGGLVLETIPPELLSESDYKKYGLSIQEVRQLSNLKIKEINAKILAEEENVEGGKAKFDPRKLILSSGSGFVDTIVLLSIMATEIMVGLLIAFSFMR